jgi:hypothetical protein
VFATQVTDDGRRGEDLLPVCDVGQDTLERTARGGFQVVGICLFADDGEDPPTSAVQEKGGGATDTYRTPGDHYGLRLRRSPADPTPPDKRHLICND